MSIAKAENNIVSISGYRGEDIFANSIRKIANNIILQEIKGTGDVKSITVLTPSNGCTTGRVVQQLAFELASQGSRILVLSLPGMKCPASYIIDTAKAGKLVEECIERTDNKNIDYLSLDEVGRSCGFTLDKASLAALLGQMKNRYRRILIETIPLEDDMSGFMAACVTDGAYFMINDEIVRSENTERCYRELKQAGTKILGIIYSNVEMKKMKKIQGKSRLKHG